MPISVVYFDKQNAGIFIFSIFCVKSGNKTFDQHFGVNLKKQYFCYILKKICCFFIFSFSAENAENEDFNKYQSKIKNPSFAILGVHNMFDNMFDQ